MIWTVGLWAVPSRAQAQRFSPPKNYIDTIVAEQASRAGVDYGRAYEAARRSDTTGLAALFRVTAHMDAAGADEHAAVLWTMLRWWGDARFAVVLRAQAADVRRGVRCQLDFFAPNGWERTHPQTATLAPKDPHC